MKLMIIMAGLPRSGKSTWIKEYGMERYVIGADNIRRILHGQQFIEQAEPMVWAVRRYILDNTLMQGLDCIIDETNLTVKRREDLIALAKHYGYKVNCVYVRTPKEICIKRAEVEGNFKLLKVIERMDAYTEVPTNLEGFNFIEVISPD